MRLSLILRPAPGSIGAPGSSIVILIPDNIFFWKGIPSLNFDNLDRLGPAACEPVFCASLYESVLTILVVFLHTIKLDMCDPSHNHPMLIPVLVTLKAETVPGIYPGLWTVKQLSKLRPPAAHEEAKAVERNISTTRSSRVMKLVTSAELALGKYISYPFGIRCLITCSKPL
jgi:hypothetical protein